VRPFLPQIVGALHNAMSLALSGVFWVAVVGAVLGFLATLVIRELPLRGSGRQAGEAFAEVRDEEPEVVVVS
jgi:hypothetical protein